MILAQKALVRLKHARIRWMIVAAVPLFGVVAAFGTAPDTATEDVTVERVIQNIDLPARFAAAPAPQDASYVREERIQRGDSIATLLARLQVDDAEAVQFLRTTKQARALYQLIPGRTVRTTTTADGRLLKLRYVNGGTVLAVDRAEAGFRVTEQAVQIERHVQMKSAEIRSSLFAATDAAGVSDAVAIQLADIFGGDVDFHRDLRKGDRFSVVYEAFYHQGEAVRTGRVLAAEFVNQGKAYQAFWFQHPDGGGGYYGPDGKNLRKQFLRSPLEFSRISSGFSMRFHPILQTWRAHKGIDYAAPTGTRVRATADGVVESMGPMSGYGNVIVLRHQSKYTTWYGHLSGYAKGLAKGKRVAQGDVIGFVGMTGLATGPHLHYEFRINNVHQNPLRVAMPDAPPILPQQRAQFAAAVGTLEHDLMLLRGLAVASVE